MKLDEIKRKISKRTDHIIYSRFIIKAIILSSETATLM